MSGTKFVDKMFQQTPPHLGFYSSSLKGWFATIETRINIIILLSRICT
jgi:hypothetical protein